MEDLTETGAVATVQSIIMLLKYNMMQYMMAPLEYKYSSGAAKRKMKKMMTQSRSRKPSVCRLHEEGRND